MKADSINLFDFLGNGKTIFEIPVFQRNYEWGKPQCEQLFNDLLTAEKEDQDHFIGAVVYVTDSGKKMSHIYRIIDGQQRLMSLTLLLKAISDIDAENKDEIEEQYLTNKYLDANNHLKLKPVDHDADAFFAVMNGKEYNNPSKVVENYNYFNDWLIAIAAYNCGVGAMNKILRKAEKKDFWYLVDKKLLPQQTADYVPKLIAIADLAINSEYYQIDLPNHNEEYEMLINEKNGDFDYIIVEKAYSLKQLASEMRMDYETLKKLNPSFVRGMTYPVKKSEIRLPLGMKKSAEDAIAKLIPIDFPFKYTVEKGDSLWSISRKYKVSIQSICDLNDIRENDILRIGKILYIPAK